MQNKDAFYENIPINVKVRPLGHSRLDEDEEYYKLQLTYRNLIFNDQECRILVLRDITAQKKL
jgi:hypothetical protein